MTLWKESTNILPADGDLVWVRRFPGIEHPKQAIFNFGGGTSSTFAVTVYAPTSATPTILTIPAYLIHSWRPRSISPPPPGACAAQEAAGDPTGIVTPAFLGQLYHDTSADTYYRSTGETTADWTAIGGSCPPPYSDCTMLVGSGEPTGIATPNFIGQLYHDTDVDGYYRSTGMTSADWTAIGTGAAPNILTTPDDLAPLLGSYTVSDIPTLSNIIINAETNLGGYTFNACLTLSEIHLPNLLSIDPTQTQYGQLWITSNPALTVIEAPLLTETGGDLSASYNATLPALDLPLFTTAHSQLFCTDNPSLTSINVPLLTTVSAALYVQHDPLLTILTLPSLTTIGTLNVFDNATLTTIDAPLLTTIDGTLLVINNPLLTTLNCPILTTITYSPNISNCPALSSLSLPAWIPTDGTETIDFNSDALDVTSVEAILAACVAAAVTTCAINLSGGTNAGLTALSPTGQANAAALGAQLSINP
jgi:hypothetical protein